MLRHANAFVCSPEVHDVSHHPPPTLLQLSAAPHTLSIGSSRAYPSTCSAPNRPSNPIAHRVRRKHQRLPPSLLIENASDRVPLRSESVLPEAFPIKPSDKPDRARKQSVMKRRVSGNCVEAPVAKLVRPGSCRHRRPVRCRRYSYFRQKRETTPLWQFRPRFRCDRGVYCPRRCLRTA